MKKMKFVRRVWAGLLVAALLLTLVPGTVFGVLLGSFRGSRNLRVVEASELKAYITVEKHEAEGDAAVPVLREEAEPEAEEPDVPMEGEPDPDPDPDPDPEVKPYTYTIHVVKDGSELSDSVVVSWNDSSNAMTLDTDEESVSATVSYDGLTMALSCNKDAANGIGGEVVVGIKALDAMELRQGGSATVTVGLIDGCAMDDAAKLSADATEGLTAEFDAENAKKLKLSADADAPVGNGSYAVTLTGESETVYAVATGTVNVLAGVEYQIGDTENALEFTDPSAVAITITAKAYGSAVPAEKASYGTSSESMTEAALTWTEGDEAEGYKTYTATLAPANLEDGEYTVEIGNQQRGFILDSEGPTLKLTTPFDITTINGKQYIKVGAVDSAEGANPESINVTIAAELVDNHLPENQAELSFSQTCEPDKETSVAKTFEGIYDSLNNPLKAATLNGVPLTVENGKVSIQLYVDRRAPSTTNEALTITIEDNDDNQIENGYYSGDVGFHFTVQDFESGLKKVSYELTDANSILAGGETSGEFDVTATQPFQVSFSLKDNVEGDVILTVKAEDQMGNTRTETRTISVDTVEPALELTRDAAETLEAKDGVFYHSDTVSYSLTASDSHLQKVELEYQIDGAAAVTETFTVSSQLQKTILVSDKEEGGENVFCIVTADKALRYLKATAYDTAGKESTITLGDQNLIVDATAPTLTIESPVEMYEKNGKLYLYVSPATVLNYSQAGEEEEVPIELTLLIDDANFDYSVFEGQEGFTVGEDSVTYQASFPRHQVTPVVWAIEFRDLAENPIESAAFTVNTREPEDEDPDPAPTTVSTLAADADGKLRMFFVDLQSPEIVVTENELEIIDLTLGNDALSMTDSEGNVWHLGDLSYEIHVTDHEAKAEGEGEGEGEGEDEGEEESEDNGIGVSGLCYHTNEDEAVKQTYYQDQDAEGSDNVYTVKVETVDQKSSNAVMLYLTVTDYAGNSQNYEYGPILVDRKNPDVDIQLPNTEEMEPDEGIYYFPSKQTITVTVGEQNFDTGSTVKVFMADGHSLKFTDGDWEVDGDGYRMDITVSDLNADVLTVTEDGTLGLAVVKVEVVPKDLGGHGETSSKDCAFIVDTEAPTIVSFDRITTDTPVTDADGIDYYKAEQTYEIVVEDRNFSTDKSTVTAIVEGMEGVTLGSDRWTLVEDTDNQYKMQITVSDKDADVLTLNADQALGAKLASIMAAAMDKAENTTEETVEPNMIVDTEAPTIISFDRITIDEPVPDDGIDYYKAEQTYEIVVEDPNFSTAKSIVTALVEEMQEGVEFSNWTSVDGFQNRYQLRFTVSDKDADVLTLNEDQTLGAKLASIVAALMDKAENKTEETVEPNMIVDTIDPEVVKLEKTTEDSAVNTVDGIAYYTAAQTYRVEIKDNNFDDASTVTINVTDKQDVVLSGDRWKAVEKDGNVYYLEFTVSDVDGDGVDVLTVNDAGTLGVPMTKVKVNAMDLAKRTNNEANDEIQPNMIVDTEQPVVTATFNQNVAYIRYNDENGRIYYLVSPTPVSGNDGEPKETYELTLTVTDRNLLLNDDYLNFTSSGGEKWDGSGNTYTVTKTVEVSRDRTAPFDFTVKVLDLAKQAPKAVAAQANNKSSSMLLDFHSDNTDGEKGVCSIKARADRRRASSLEAADTPVLIITPMSGNSTAVPQYSTKKNNEDWNLYDDSLDHFSVSILDKEEGTKPETDYNAGVQLVSWTLTDGMEGNFFSGSDRVEYNDLKDAEIPSRKLDTPLKIQIDKQGKNETNSGSVTVTVCDNVGNLIDKTLEFGLDNLAPRVEVSYEDKAEVQNEKYFKDDRTITVTVDDLNFDPGRAELYDIKTEIAGDPWVPTNEPHKWTKTFVYDQDGDYTFSVEIRDLANNVTKDEDVVYEDAPAQKDFVIDKTGPVVTVTYNLITATNGRYFNEERIATLEIVEHNFDEKDLVTEFKAQQPEVEDPQLTGYERNDDTSTWKVYFSKDADYTVHVEYTDLAGNQVTDDMVTYVGDAPRDFTVDQTPPEVVISPIDAINSGSVTPTVTFTDTNLDKSKESLNADLKRDDLIHTGDAVWTYTVSSETEQQVVWLGDDLPHEKAWDGIYNLYASAKDLAGNVGTDVKMDFSVNRFGSTYKANNELTRQVAHTDFYSKEAVELQVIELNCNKLDEDSISITLLLGDQAIILERDKDYTMTPSGDAAKGYQYLYVISPDAFLEDGALREGVYDVNFFSKDEAGHSNSNTTNADDDANMLTLKLTLDCTNPVLSIDGVNPGDRIQKDSQDIRVIFNDNIAVSKVVVWYDAGDGKGEQEKATLIGEDLSAANGVYTFTAYEANENQTVRAAAYDAAGNEIELDPVEFYLNSNLLRQFVHNRPLFFGTLGGALALGSGGFFLLAKKKKKKEDVVSTPA